MKIALYGGSFNPPHLGHRAVALTVMERLRPVGRGSILYVPPLL